MCESYDANSTGRSGGKSVPEYDSRVEDKMRIKTMRTRSCFLRGKLVS